MLVAKLFVFFATLIASEAIQKCGILAPECKYNENGDIDWNLVGISQGSLCKTGFNLVKDGKGQNCCEETKTTSTTSPPTYRTCPHQVTCTQNKIWSEERCECVCPEMDCNSGTFNPVNCKCDVEETITDQYVLFERTSKNQRTCSSVRRTGVFLDRCASSFTLAAHRASGKNDKNISINIRSFEAL